MPDVNLNQMANLWPLRTLRPRALRPNLGRLRTMDDPPARSRPRLAKSGVLFSAHDDARAGPLSVTDSVSDPSALIEAYFAAGYTDGLPVVPPTEKSIADTLAAAGLRAEEPLG